MITQHTAPLLLDFLDRINDQFGSLFESAEKEIPKPPDLDSEDSVSTTRRTPPPELRGKIRLFSTQIQVDFRQLSTDTAWFTVIANEFKLEIATKEDTHQKLSTQLLAWFRDERRNEDDIEESTAGFYLLEGDGNSSKSVISLGECGFEFESTTHNTNTVQTKFKTKFTSPMIITPEIHTYETLWSRYQNYVRMYSKKRSSSIRQQILKRSSSLVNPLHDGDRRFLPPRFETDFDYRVNGQVRPLSLEQIVRGVMGVDLPEMNTFVPMTIANYVSFPLVDVLRMTQNLSLEIDKLHRTKS